MKTSKGEVTALGYIGLSVSNAREWHALLTGIFGLTDCADVHEDVTLYRLDDYRYRIAIEPDGSDQLSYIGWEVSTLAGLEALVLRIESSGISVQRGTEEQCRRRGVAALYRFTAPDGIPSEIYHGPALSVEPLARRHDSSGFKTGELGLGHVVLTAGDPVVTVEWYCDVLGFRLSDRIHWGEARATFLHCNPRHHSLAILNPCFGLEPGRINHFMLEANSLDDVGRAYDRILQRKLPLALTLGRHSNDRMVSFYLVTPSGFWIEYGHGGVEIDDSIWQPAVYDSPKLWGHSPP